jgi:hypothetical protein
MTDEEIEAEIRRLKELKKAAKKSALTKEELIQREMDRLDARDEAKRRHAELKAQRARQQVIRLPSERGVWRCVEDGVRIAVAEVGRPTFVVRDNKLTQTRIEWELLKGTWEKIDALEKLENLPQPASPQGSQAQRDAETHQKKTREWKERKEQLFDEGLKPCADFDCTATLSYHDPKTFCEECREKRR